MRVSWILSSIEINGSQCLRLFCPLWIYELYQVMLLWSAVVIKISEFPVPTALLHLQSELHWKTLRTVELFPACWKAVIYQTSGSCRSRWNCSRFLKNSINMSHNCGHSAMKGIWLWADMVVVVAVSGEHVGGGITWVVAVCSGSSVNIAWREYQWLMTLSLNQTIMSGTLSCG